MSSIDEARGGDNSSPQPFTLHALKYFNLGFAVIPCDGKKPLVAWKKYQAQKPSQATIYRWVKHFPSANIGIIAGKISNLTVIDCDNLNLSIEELQKEFGESPFIVSTPSGGKHLYYSSNQEAKKINFDGRKIDLIAQGAFIIAAYSFNKDKNGFYSVVKGGFDYLTNLPSLKEGAIDFELKNELSVSRKEKQPQSGFLADFLVNDGQRNDYLFNELKKVAKSFRSLEALEKKAFEINSFVFSKPLGNQEIVDVAKSIWGYKIKGCLYVGDKGGYSFCSEKELRELTKFSKALALLLNLRFYHQGLKRDFCIDQIKVAKKLGWNRETLKKAIDVLLEKGFLIKRNTENEKIRRGNKIKAKAYIYSLC
jgi:hypothetical protein